MTIDTEVRHVPKIGTNLFADFGFRAAEARNRLQDAPRRHVGALGPDPARHGLRQADGARMASPRVPRPHASDRVHRETAKLAIDIPAETLGRVGKSVRLQVG